MTPNDYDLQTEIQKIFSDVLNLTVGVNQDFFAAGGDSLAVEQVLTAISARLSIDVPGWALLDHPSASALAAFLSDR